MAFMRAASTSEVPLGKMKGVRVGDKDVLIANVGGSYYAIRGLCTHAAGVLSNGTLDGNIVTCPKHGTQFDVTNGKSVRGPKILGMRMKTKDEPSYPVKIEGADILIDV